MSLFVSFIPNSHYFLIIFELVFYNWPNIGAHEYPDSLFLLHTSVTQIIMWKK